MNFEDKGFTLYRASHSTLDFQIALRNLVSGRYQMSLTHKCVEFYIHRVNNENLVARLRAAPFQSVFCSLACRDMVDPLKSSERRCRHSQVHFLRMPAKSEFLAPQLNSTPSSDENHGAHHQVAHEEIRRF